MPIRPTTIISRSALAAANPHVPGAANHVPTKPAIDGGINGTGRQRTRPKYEEPEVVIAIREAEEIYLTAVVLGEMLAGFLSGDRHAKNQTELARFLGKVHVLAKPANAGETQDSCRCTSAFRTE